MVGSYAIYHDLSDVHRQQYFESLLEISPTAIITVGLDDQVASWNPAAERLFGYSQDEALGRNVDELIAGHRISRTRLAKSTSEAPGTNTGSSHAAYARTARRSTSSCSLLPFA